MAASHMLSQSSPQMSGGYWLEPHTPEYDQISYYLSACISEKYRTVTKLEVWKVENLELTYRYEQETVNMMKLPVWVNSVTLGKVNSLETVCTRGFELSGTQGLFSTGVLEFKGTTEVAETEEHSFLFCEIAIGRAAIYDGDITDAEVPAGYNSLYIPSIPLDRNLDGKFSLQEYQAAASFDDRDASRYHHQYLIRNQAQVLPKFIVRFQLSRHDSLQSDSDTKLSMQVGELAVEEELLLDPVSFATVLGSSKPAPVRRNLISVDQAFLQAIADGGISDSVAENKCKWIEKQLTTLDQKVRAVNLNYAEIAEAIVAASDETSEKLQVMTRQKLETCLSIEIELRRQQEQVKWLDGTITEMLHSVQEKLRNSCLSAAQRYRLKLDFLRCWKSHNILRNSVNRSKPAELQILGHVHADIKLQTGLNLYLDPFFSHETNVGKEPTNLEGASDNSVVHLSGTHGTVAHRPDEVQGHYGDPTRAGHLNELNKISGKFEMPVKPLESLMSVALRNLVDGEIEVVQSALERAIDDVQYTTSGARGGVGAATIRSSTMPLPESIVRPLISGDRYSAPLHGLLNGLEDDDTAEGQGDDRSSKFEDIAPQRPATAGVAATAETRLHFDNSMRSVLGSAPFVDLSSNGTAGKPEKMPLAKYYTPATTSDNKPFRDNYHNDVISQVSYPSVASSLKSSFQRTSQHQQESLASASGGVSSCKDTVRDPALIRLTVKQLASATLPFTQYSLQDFGRRKRAQLEAKQVSGFEIGIKSLISSSKIIGQQPVAAASLYFALPFFSKPPLCKLIYSTDTCLRSLDELYAKTMQTFKGPTLTIVRSGEFTFGFYVTHQIVPNCAWAGSPACFLFSITLDLKLPYHGKVPPISGSGSIGISPKPHEPTAFYAQSDYLFIGNGDLSIDQSLTNGSSELENSFGVGLGLNSVEAMCVLAGSPLFTIDDMEVWAVIA